MSDLITSLRILAASALPHQPSWSAKKPNLTIITPPNISYVISHKVLRFNTDDCLPRGELIKLLSDCTSMGFDVLYSRFICVIYILTCTRVFTSPHPGRNKETTNRVGLVRPRPLRLCRSLKSAPLQQPPPCALRV